mmetsp:Transcript_127969/g.190641  ORF Transcript_127969/g.190641 Transcript_127969/m.190641 type:complete len:565 (+) Transcript_127969:22-1716(+)
MSKDDQRIIDEYSSLLDRSQQLFSGLRDVPQFGKQWQPYFQRTFEVYTKLWKFQQINRSVLEGNKDRDRLTFKRHDIGEIASKIGQLYYHYYLRTSEPNYLHESCVFYEAIRTRGYFKDVLDAKNAVPMVKKLRYYARFIVVCLLLNKRKLVESLVSELTQDVDSYIKTFRPNDTQEWQFVLQEITQFLEADNILNVDNLPAPISRRLSSQVTIDQTARIKVQEAILVGNYQHQVKFSELTLDMFRIMQCLEWEPESNMEGNSERKDQPGEERKGKRNPHKYLMYRPTMSQFLVFLANSFKELQDNNVLLLYVSADGIKGVNPQPETEGESTKTLCSRGGLALNSRRSPEKQQTGANADCLYPEDLLVYTRKHLFLIIDSDNSAAFEEIPSLFGKQVVCLMSPRKQPSLDKTEKEEKIGNLFTLFLCDPLSAFCYVMNKTNISKEILVKANEKKENFLSAILVLIQTQPGIDPALLLFSQEDFLRKFIQNYIFCVATLLYHKKFQSSRGKYWPKITPSLPNELFHHRTLQSEIYDLAMIIGASNFLLGELDLCQTEMSEDTSEA